MGFRFLVLSFLSLLSLQIFSMLFCSCFFIFLPVFMWVVFLKYMHILGVFWVWWLRHSKADWQFCVYGQGLSIGGWSGSPSVSCGNPNSQQRLSPSLPWATLRREESSYLKFISECPGRQDGKGVQQTLNSTCRLWLRLVLSVRFLLPFRHQAEWKKMKTKPTSNPHTSFLIARVTRAFVICEFVH